MRETGKSHNAEDILHRMEENDPESVAIVSELGCVAYHPRRLHQAAVSHYQDAIKLDPHSPIAYWSKAESLASRAKFHEAVEALQVQQRNGLEPPILVASDTLWPAKAKSRRRARRFQTLQSQAHAGYVDPYLIAVIYLGLRDKTATRMVG